jgi:hypothetical protein
MDVCESREDIAKDVTLVDAENNGNHKCDDSRKKATHCHTDGTYVTHG